MGFIKKYKNILIVIAVVVVSFVAYSMFFGGEGNQNQVLTSDAANGVGTSAQQEASRELLSLLLDLRAIQLDESIFDDPAFRALTDFGQDLVQEPTGRRNPFAPLGGAAAAVESQ
ncbi:hypothetical protein COU17_02560 [Candidatus Kaiserbacteria bacterium CG10_big_fil_rev_8_21_14_0_10_49_17]|uniref:Uncharacterized protein n=1 Tax=Candidatus Kaiserbacteria bacterium CG10_big_fil_rev_8_21_14_0_10_49_17 TaxID=1974609 RepID=A0A2M6WE20_9BACT|nr:MAG: hypothetical protein COU17_02560 [Candidatus Kaiserbacteria bacterium CG10_big_fil_rev_8_21_14_0_10_49_17]